jgi:hypothetical protein
MHPESQENNGHVASRRSVTTFRTMTVRRPKRLTLLPTCGIFDWSPSQTTSQVVSFVSAGCVHRNSQRSTQLDLFSAATPGR